MLQGSQEGATNCALEVVLATSDKQSQAVAEGDGENVGVADRELSHVAASCPVTLHKMSQRLDRRQGQREWWSRSQRGSRSICCEARDAQFGTKSSRACRRNCSAKVQPLAVKGRICMRCALPNLTQRGARQASYPTHCCIS